MKSCLIQQGRPYVFEGWAFPRGHVEKLNNLFLQTVLEKFNPWMQRMGRTQREPKYICHKTLAVGPSASHHARHYRTRQLLSGLLQPRATASQLKWWAPSNKAQALPSPELMRNFSRAYLASRARANTPAASGAAADVPEWRRVQLPYKSVVACNDIRCN